MARPCSHCGLDVPSALIDEEKKEQFCCSGCKMVYAILHQEGLENFYNLLDDTDKQQAIVTNKSYAEFDEERFHELYVKDENGLKRIDLYLQGVHCTACVWLVEKLPALLRGVHSSRLDLGRQLATVTWDPNSVSLSAIARRLDSLGYPVHPFRGIDRYQMRKKEDRSLLIKIGVAGACAGNVMMLAAALYAGIFGGISPEHRSYFRWLSFFISLPVVFFAAAPFFKGAIGALRSRALHMDLPIAIGIGTGFIWGAKNTILGEGDIYFDSVTVLIFLLLIGRWLQQRQQRGAADAAEMLYALTPTSVRLVTSAPNPEDEGEIREVPIESITEGALIEVRAGETIPADGQIVLGTTTLNAALLSGESKPIQASVGDEVHAGTTNIAASVRIQVHATGEETRVGQLMRRIEDYAKRRAPVVLLADRISGYFVATTLILAALTALYWSFYDTKAAIEHAMALLIVSCPCALGLATPLAVSVAIGRAARQGILIKGGDVLERLARPGAIFLDKTGTLTKGEQKLIHWIPLSDSIEKNQAKAYALALEAHSAHPIANAMRRSLKQLESNFIAEEVKEETGRGIKGLVDKHRVHIGSQQFIEDKLSLTINKTLEEKIEHELTNAYSPILLAIDDELIALLSFGDPIRDDANSLIDDIRKLGFTPYLLSGDHQRVAEAVASTLTIKAEHVEGHAMPEDKLKRIELAAKTGPVLMVGDGVNDSAALAAATAGIAVHGGAEASLIAADVFMSQPGLARISALLHGAKATLNVIRNNVIFSLFYNLIGATLAITGVINPLIAAILMPISSLTVVTNSFRSKTF